MKRSSLAYLSKIGSPSPSRNISMVRRLLRSSFAIELRERAGALFAKRLTQFRIAS
jgi:hypothetical protein